MQITCPSGLKLTVRPWTLGDHAELLNTKELRTSFLPRRMLELVVQEIVDPGPYKFKPGPISNFTAGGLSISDITVANVLIRLGTDAKLMLYPTCQSCRRPTIDPIEVNLQEAPLYIATEEGRAHLGSGVPVSRTFKNLTVALKAIRGDDLQVLSALQEQEPTHVLEIQLCCSIAEIRAPGLKKPLSTLTEIRTFMRNQAWSLRDEVDATVDELWGGVDMDYTFTCDRAGCLTQQTSVLPLDPTFYGLDLSARRSRRQKRSSGKRSAADLMQGSFSHSSSEPGADAASTLED